MDERKASPKMLEHLFVISKIGSSVASSVASSAPQTETSTTVGAIDTIECTALHLCATTMAQQEVANPHWTAFADERGLRM